MLKRYIFKYGFVGGLVASVFGTLNWLLIAKPLGVAGSQSVGYLTITLSLLCIPLGVKYFRDKLNNGVVSFVQALKIGLGITGVAGIVMAVHSVLFFAFQKEEFIAWQRSDLTPTQLVAFDEQLAQLPDFAYTPWFQGIVMFCMVFLIGAVVNVISALILKRDKNFNPPNQ